MKTKKLLGVLLLTGMLLVSIGTTAFAAIGTFYGNSYGSDYVLIISNSSNTSRYSQLALKSYDKDWKLTGTIGTASKILSKVDGGNNANSLTKTSTALHVKGSGQLYNSSSSQSGVAFGETKTLK